MAIDVTMPQMGESVVEGTIARWLVKEGDAVHEDQPLVEISTDKVDTEIPSPGSGVITRIIAREGQTVAVGAKIAEIGEGDVAAKPEQAGATHETIGQAAEPSETKPLLETPPADMAESVAAAAGGPELVRSGVTKTAGLRRYSPVVQKMAAEYGVDLEQISGTGIGGRVTKRDLVAYLESKGHEVAPPPPPPSPPPLASGKTIPIATISAGVAEPALQKKAVTPPPSPSGLAGVVFRPPIYEPREGDITEPFSRRRKLIAEHMVYSKTHAPHVGTVAEVDLTRAMALRESRKEEFRRREGFALTLLPIVAAATVRALREFPRMNASVSGDSLIIRRQINLGIAMDDTEGLVVPVIKSAEGMSITGLAREIERLRRKIADRQLAADDLAGGSFTLSNPGREGNLYGFAIINQPQVGILRMGEVKKRPVVVESGSGDAIAIRPMMYLALSYDHRVIDGVLGNRFLYRVARLIEAAEFEL
jgi:2-oxoglutarate dehydrogenase E2 component (dihydrolipoamide succinyltransferase)